MGLLFFEVQSEQDFGFNVFEVTKAKGLSFGVFDEFVGGFQFGIRVEMI